MTVTEGTGWKWRRHQAIVDNEFDARRRGLAATMVPRGCTGVAGRLRLPPQQRRSGLSTMTSMVVDEVQINLLAADAGHRRIRSILHREGAAPGGGHGQPPQVPCLTIDGALEAGAQREVVEGLGQDL
nr:unnamed protein product [Digitaria exilis]